MSKKKWEPEPVGTYVWPDELAAQFSSENGIHWSQVPPGYAGRIWVWECSAGHRWEKPASSRFYDAARWQRWFGTFACPYCVLAEHGPLRSCGHPDPQMATSFALGQVRKEGRANRGRLCPDCNAKRDLHWACGLQARKTQGDTAVDPTRRCPDCEESDALLELHPERNAIVAALHLTPHGEARSHWCGIEDHPPVELSYYGVARGYDCKWCWKRRQSEGFRTPAGEVLRVDRYLPTSKLEQRVRDYLSLHHPVADPSVANAVSTDGFLFNRGEVTPDILITDGRVAVEVDSPGRDGEGHRGTREDADRLKDAALVRAGWSVVRLRLGGLESLDSATVNVVHPEPDQGRPEAAGRRRNQAAERTHHRRQGMTLDPVELMLADLHEQYAQETVPVPDTSRKLYAPDGRFTDVFANLHFRLHDHFVAVNDRIRSTRHYWAESSRDLIAVIDELNQTLSILRGAGLEVQLSDEYQKAVAGCDTWLSSSGGSTIPDDFLLLPVNKYHPVFSRPDTTIQLNGQKTPAKLKQVGEGSYAHVYSYVDPDYGIKFAVKRAKKNLSERDLERFKNEFAILSELSFPYIVEVYQYNEARNEYRMEYCDNTLRDYVRHRNNQMTFGTRKRIALQFLYGLNYIQGQGYLHRDISLQNVMLKVYKSGAVLVKLSDFGLVKDQDSNFTRTHTEMRGTILDPLLEDFKNYEVRNEIYAIGKVLTYIFTGREQGIPEQPDVKRTVQACTAPEMDKRYANVVSIIRDVAAFNVVPTDTPS